MTARSDIEAAYAATVSAVMSSDIQAFNALSGDSETYNANQTAAFRNFTNQALLILADKLDKLSK